MKLQTLSSKLTSAFFFLRMKQTVDLARSECSCYLSDGFVLFLKPKGPFHTQAR